MKSLKIAVLACILGVVSPLWADDAAEVTLPTYVNINTADEATLAEVLDGVGMSKARAIVAFRKENGNFAAPEDLATVKGIGERIVEMNAGKIRVKD